MRDDLPPEKKATDREYIDDICKRLFASTQAKYLTNEAGRVILKLHDLYTSGLYKGRDND